MKMKMMMEMTICRWTLGLQPPHIDQGKEEQGLGQLINKNLRIDLPPAKFVRLFLGLERSG